MSKQHSTTGPRALWPSVATSLPLARCSIQAQLLFDRLIAGADDQGRLQGEVLVVKASCMPLVAKATPRALDRWLGELSDAGLVIRYEAGGQPLLQLRGWWDHQAGMRWRYPSRWPAPEMWTDREPRTPTSGGDPAGMAQALRPRDAGKAPRNANAVASANANAQSVPAAPEHYGQHPDCLVCAPLRVRPGQEAQSG